MSPSRTRSSHSSCEPPPYPEDHEDDHRKKYQPQEPQRAGSLGRFIPGRDALARSGDPDAEPDVEVDPPRSQDHVIFPGTCVRRNHQGQGDARRFPGEDLHRGNLQPRHGIPRIGRVRDLHRGIPRVPHVQRGHRVAVPRGGRAPDADQWVHVFLAVSSPRVARTPHPRLQTLLTAISTGMRLIPVTVTIPADTADCSVVTGEETPGLSQAVLDRRSRQVDGLWRCTGTVVPRPSGCLSRWWLPFTLVMTNPAFI